MKVFAVSVFSFFLAVSAFGINVQSIQCGLGVKNRKIVKESDNFKTGDTVCCISTITDIHKKTHIIHRWILNAKQYDIRLNLKPYKRFRTWSCKTARQPGVWKLEILDSSDKMIREKIFVVKDKGE